MQGKILIVDAITTNRIALKVKLSTSYYEVLQADSLDVALRFALDQLPDLVITALELPDGDAAALCAAFRRHPLTELVPIIAIGCQSGPAQRMATLEAGAHDVLDRRVNDMLLLGRVRSLIRANNAAAEWRMREDTCRALGLAEPVSRFQDQGTCVLAGADIARLKGFAAQLGPLLRTRLSLASVGDVMGRTEQQAVPEVYVLALPSNSLDAQEHLRAVSALRAGARTRHVGIIVLQVAPNAALGAQALDLGADDLMPDGFDAAELALRIKAVMRRKRMSDQLRASVRTGLQAAVFDPLTGLYNRRYAMPHLGRIADHASRTGRSYAVMAADLDHFKRINDRYGHAAGDAVLVEVANRLRQSLRGADMVARIGGEEFLIILPGTTLLNARETGQRLCSEIAAKPFVVPGSATPIPVTISVGMAVSTVADGTYADAQAAGQAMLARADAAMYAAKEQGRNQVTLARPAA